LYFKQKFVFLSFF